MSFKRYNRPLFAKPIKPGKRVAFYALHGIACMVGFVLLFTVILLYHGPFTNYRDYIVTVSMETHQNKFFATAFLSKSEIDSILARTNPAVRSAQEDVTNVQVKAPGTPAPSASAEASAKSSPTAAANMQILDITGKTYEGKLMVIPDPSKVTVGLAPKLGQIGAPLSQIVQAEHALGGVNAGGFLDDNFTGTGASPDGIVIQDGQVKFQKSGTDSFSLIGFNRNNVLVVSNGMTLDEINKSSLRCAISFGPALIVNGNPMVTSGGTSLQPRTAIGQKKDGTVLLLTIDGRQSKSAGANYTDIMNVLLQYGAYNAANLDGGSSTTMNYIGKTINSPCDINGERSIATAYLVMP